MDSPIIDWKTGLRDNEERRGLAIPADRKMMTPRAMAIVQTIPIPLPPTPYAVHVGRGLLADTGQLLRSAGLGGRAGIITDSNVRALHADRVADSMKAAGYDVCIVSVPAGEASKSLEQTGVVCEELIARGLDRSSFVVALGGGVVGDLAGFVAAVYYRGIPVVQIPTSVMAQVDSSVGGKTGVNAHAGKNLIGAFHQPSLVIADLDTLATLPPRAFREGFAEVIKHGIIRDAPLLDLMGDPESIDLDAIIPRSIGIKADIVVLDEKETLDLRALLNFGHTIGHGIEQAAGYGQLLHGEAISLGLVAACRLSESKSGFPPESTRRVCAMLQALDLPIVLPDGISTEAILAAMRTDKKFASGRIRFVLVRELGDAFVSSDVTESDIRGAIGELRNKDQKS